jgi:hypothetical protein
MNNDIEIYPVRKDREQILKIFILNHFPADSDLIGEIGSGEIELLNSSYKRLTLKN